MPLKALLPKVEAECKYAERLPKPRETGDPERDAEAVLEHKSFVKLITLLEGVRKTGTPEGLVLQTLGFVESRLDKVAVVDEHTFDLNVTCVGKLPSSWSAAWLLATVPSLTSAKVQAIARQDSEGVDRLFRFAHQLPKTFALSKECMDKRVAFRLLKKLWELHGKRMSGNWVAKHITAAGVADWKVGGCYSFVWGEGGRATEIKHISGESGIG